VRGSDSSHVNYTTTDTLLAEKPRDASWILVAYSVSLSTAEDSKDRYISDTVVGLLYTLMCVVYVRTISVERN